MSTLVNNVDGFYLWLDVSVVLGLRVGKNRVKLCNGENHSLHGWDVKEREGLTIPSNNLPSMTRRPPTKSHLLTVSNHTTLRNKPKNRAAPSSVHSCDKRYHLL